MIKLSELRDFAYSGEPEHYDWYLAFSVHRDSDTLDQSNYQVFERRVKDADDSESEDANYVLFHASHWAVGWMDHILVRPGSKCAEVAEEMLTYLHEQHPVLDEDHYSNLESELHGEGGDNCRGDQWCSECEYEKQEANYVAR